MPAAGYRWNDSLNNAGSWGNYWSRTLNSSNPNNAYNLNFNSGNVNGNNNNRNNGFTVRAVRVSQHLPFRKTVSVPFLLICYADEPTAIDVRPAAGIF